VVSAARTFMRRAQKENLAVIAKTHGGYVTGPNPTDVPRFPKTCRVPVGGQHIVELAPNVHGLNAAAQVGGAQETALCFPAAVGGNEVEVVQILPLTTLTTADYMVHRHHELTEMAKRNLLLMNAGGSCVLPSVVFVAGCVVVGHPSRFSDEHTLAAQLSDDRGRMRGASRAAGTLITFAQLIAGADLAVPGLALSSLVQEAPSGLWKVRCVSEVTAPGSSFSNGAPLYAQLRGARAMHQLGKFRWDRFSMERARCLREHADMAAMCFGVVLGIVEAELSKSTRMNRPSCVRMYEEAAYKLGTTDADGVVLGGTTALSVQHFVVADRRVFTSNASADAQGDGRAPGEVTAFVSGANTLLDTWEAAFQAVVPEAVVSEGDAMRAFRRATDGFLGDLPRLLKSLPGFTLYS